MCDKKFELAVLAEANSWIFIRICYKEVTGVTESVYWKPSININIVCEYLEDAIINVLESTSFDAFLIGGDFNSRLGQLRLSDTHITDNTTLEETRISLDHCTNEKGRCRNELMEGLGFILLNGRTPGNVSGNLTLGNALGKSTIDLVWSHVSCISCITTLNVNHIITQFDHFPITVTLKIQMEESSTRAKFPSPQLKWNERCAELYKNVLRWAPRVCQNFNDTSVSVLYLALENAIKAAAQVSHMLTKTQKRNSHNTRWHDNDCKNMRRLVTMYLQYCKNDTSNQLLWNYYYAIKREYYALLRKKKRDFNSPLTKMFDRAKSSTDFWRADRPVNYKGHGPSNIIMV